MPNPVVHFEISGKDGVKIQQFYSDAFGWTIDASNPMGYGIVEAQGEGIGGGVTGGDDAGVIFYIQVDDLEAALAKVGSLGGKTVMDVMTIPGMVTMATFSDPEGNVIGLVHSETPAAE